MAELTEEQRTILDLERAWWKYAGAKEAAIRERFGISATRYYQLLAYAIEQPEAVQHDAQTVNRLRRLRDKRAVARRGAPLGRAG